MNRLPSTPFCPLRRQRFRIGDHAEACTHDHVEAGRSGARRACWRIAGRPSICAGEVLVVVAIDILCVHRGGRDVVERHAGDRADFPPLVLKLVKERWHEPAVIGDVDPVVVRLDPADHLGGALRRVGVGVQDAADGEHARPGRPRWPTGP